MITSPTRSGRQRMSGGSALHGRGSLLRLARHDRISLGVFAPGLERARGRFVGQPMNARSGSAARVRIASAKRLRVAHVGRQTTSAPQRSRP